MGRVDQGQEGGGRSRVFGPAPSWRLGRSLGIDLAPLKTCNWNCVFCQLGRTRPVQSHPRPRPRAAAVLAELDAFLETLPAGSVDWITLLGSGDPLLCSEIGEVVRGVKDRSDLPLALLTNGALLSDPDIRDSVLACDAILPSLSAGTPRLHRLIHRPHPDFTYRDHLTGLRDLRRDFRGRIWVEVMLVAGANDSEGNLRTLARRLRGIRPDEIHLNIPTRPPSEAWVRPPGSEALDRAREMLGAVATLRSPVSVTHSPETRTSRNAEGPETDPYSGLERGSSSPGSPEGAGLWKRDDQGEGPDFDALAALLLRHPMTRDELAHALPWDKEELETSLQTLRQDGRLSTVSRFGKRFWVPGEAYFPEAENARPPWIFRGRMPGLSSHSSPSLPT